SVTDSPSLGFSGPDAFGYKGTNGGGSSSAMASITVTPQGPGPSASTDPATDFTDSMATLRGTVNPYGQATSYHFDYGTTTSYGQAVPSPDAAVGSDRTLHSESATIAGLQRVATYHFRIVASTSNGTAYGADSTFSPG